MCDVASEKLLAWLDGELAAPEAAGIERHLQNCKGCRDRLDLYRRTSAAFDAYCDRYAASVLAAGPRRELRTWAVGAVAAVIGALLLFIPRASVGNPSLAGERAWVLQTAAMPRFAAVTQQTGRRMPETQTNYPPTNSRQVSAAIVSPAAPAFEIAIPADAIFPPGAFPPGVSFTADVAIAPDGSAQQLRLQPQFVEFERRPQK